MRDIGRERERERERRGGERRRESGRVRGGRNKAVSE